MASTILWLFSKIRGRAPVGDIICANGDKIITSGGFYIKVD